MIKGKNSENGTDVCGCEEEMRTMQRLKWLKWRENIMICKILRRFSE